MVTSIARPIIILFIFWLELRVITEVTQDLIRRFILVWQFSSVILEGLEHLRLLDGCFICREAFEELLDFLPIVQSVPVQCVKGDRGYESGSLVPIDEWVVRNKKPQYLECLLVQSGRLLPEEPLLNVLNNVFQVSTVRNTRFRVVTVLDDGVVERYDVIDGEILNLTFKPVHYQRQLDKIS